MLSQAATVDDAAPPAPSCSDHEGVSSHSHADAGSVSINSTGLTPTPEAASSPGNGVATTHVQVLLFACLTAALYLYLVRLMHAPCLHL